MGVVAVLVGASWFSTGTLEGGRRGKTVGVKSRFRLRASEIAETSSQALVDKVCDLWKVNVTVEVIEDRRDPGTHTCWKESRATIIKPFLDGAFRWVWGIKRRKPRGIKDGGDMRKT